LHSAEEEKREREGKKERDAVTRRSSASESPSDPSKGKKKQEDSYFRGDDILSGYREGKKRGEEK